jgi:tetratricopeptide (TPR) repeat protein
MDDDQVMNPMRVTLTFLTLFAVFSAPAAAQRSEIEIGRAFYTAGEFKRAAGHFQLAIETGLNNAESFYWLGMSYQRLADIALPFGGRYNAKARICLTRAVELAPNRADYRRELFEFLLDPAGGSRSSFRQAADILHTIPESDPDYSDLRQRFESESRANSSADARLGRVFLAIPQAACSIAEIPGAALSHRPEAQPAKVAQGPR